MAVVSKKVFETDARVQGKVLRVGQVWSTAKYASAQAGLKALAEGGSLFLMTVRPPDEALWLVAILQNPKSVKDGWAASANTTPITDITALKSRIKFANGAGITAPKGKLGMSLQAARALSDDDVKLLLAAGGGAAPPPPAAPAKIYHLNGHESGKFPCLCQKCFAKAPERTEVDGEAFVRREARARERVLYYWLPEALVPDEKHVRISVEKRMLMRLRDPIVPGARTKKRRSDDEDDE